MKIFLKKILLNPTIARKIAKTLLKIHHISYCYLGIFASASEGGIHPKHRLMNYHEFFLNNIKEGESILDVGCGNGALLRDVAMKTKTTATGVEASRNNYELAKASLRDLTNVEIVHTNIWEYENNRSFDTVILSNVLEHFDNRPEFLNFLNTQFKFKKFLIRVPMFERDWLVPYKKELGIRWLLDPSHKIEYKEDEFRNELEMGGLEIQKMVFKWGEIYALAIPAGRKHFA